jgi:hypothetical protein
MKIDYDKLHNSLNNEADLRKEFEDFLNSLTAVKYSLERNESGEYMQAAVFHMWTGWCMKSILKNK